MAWDRLDVFVETISLDDTLTNKAFNMAEPYLLLSRESVDDGDFFRFLTNAKSSPHAYDGLCSVLSWRLTNGLEITPPMRAWIAGILRGETKRPKAKGGRPRNGAWLRKASVAFLVRRAVDAGLLPTRNNASLPLSASDAVVEVLARHGQHVSYDFVSKCWQTHRLSEMSDD